MDHFSNPEIVKYNLAVVVIMDLCLDHTHKLDHQVYTVNGTTWSQRQISPHCWYTSNGLNVGNHP